MDKETVRARDSERMGRMWLAIVCLRIVWTVTGQLGYIHPDEFFQSSEIVAGDILNLQVERTWEFNPDSPIRSIVPPYMMCAPAIYLFRWLNPREGSALWHSFSSQLLLILPRLTVTILGVFVDTLVYRIAANLGCQNPQACLMTFATSYVSLVYYTRTLSNTTESFLFVLLVHIVVSYWATTSKGTDCKKHLIPSNSTRSNNGAAAPEKSDQTSLPLSGNQSKTNHPEYKSANMSKQKKTTTERKTQRVKKSEVSKEMPTGKIGVEEKGKHVRLDGDGKVHNLQNMVSMYSAASGVILTLGIFNRPTFAVFAVIPCVWFLLCDMSCYPSWGRWLQMCFFKIFKLSAWVIVCSIMIIACDSFYYGSLSSNDFDHLIENYNYIQTIVMKTTIAPWNFIKYNVNKDNLAQHGLHPFYQHFAVNTPLLFGIVAIFPVITILRATTKLNKIRTECRNALTPRDGKMFLAFCYLLPVTVLSAFPHQEARFLIPVLCPLALMYGHHLFGINFKWYVSFFWIVFNIFVCGLFFGALHQGGLLPSIYEVRNRILKEPFTDYHVIFSHTYMPPRHLFQIPHSDATNEDLIFKRDTVEFKHPKVQIYDLKGDAVNEVHFKVGEIFENQNAFGNVTIFLIAPSSLDKHFCSPMDTISGTIEYELVMSFVPQITTEDPPDFIGDVFNCVNPHQSNFCNWTCSNSLFDRLTFALSLNLYSVRSVTK